MKKWFKFFCLSFFSHKTAKEGAKRGYTNVFLGFVLALAFLWVGFIGGDMLPFGTYYSNSPDFSSTVHSVFANEDADKRIYAEMENGILKVKKHGGEYEKCLLVNTFENDADRQDYSVNGFNIVIDTRSADTIAEVETYCISNNGNDIVISYEEYLDLNEAKKLQFDFKLRYTGNALELSDEAVADYKTYVDGLSDENKATTEELAKKLSENTITKSEYNKSIYELYFANYYPPITEYESTSKVPLLRNYYYHKYVSAGANNYLFIFDDYMAGSFKTKNGIDVSFYGFYSDLENGVLIEEGTTQTQANEMVDGFIKDSYKSIWILNTYTYIINVISLVPVIVLMLVVAALLTYSILKLRYVESITSFGAMFRIVGSFVWFSSLVSAVLTVILAFFVNRNIINILPILLFFAVLAIRSLVFAIKEIGDCTKQLEQQEELGEE